MNSPQDSHAFFTFTLRNRTLELTREGGGFVFLIFGVGFGAINTGNNLLYLILAMCCSLIAVSGILSELTMKRISISGRLPKTFYAEEPQPFSLSVSNKKKWFPSYSLMIRLPKKVSCGIERPVYFFNVPNGGTVEKSVMLTPRRRGKLKLNACDLSTSFPFGFFIKTKTVPIDAETLVFPPIRPVELPQYGQFSIEEGTGAVGSSGEEIHALREFREGDPLSAVHWKSSAKTGDLRIKEFSSGREQKFTVFLNLRGSQEETPLPREKIEERIAESASLLYGLIRRGNEAQLKTSDYESDYGNSPAHLENLMGYLALLEPDHER